MKTKKIRQDWRTYIVETGSYKKIIKAGSLEAAVESVFILYPPKNPSFLTRVREKHSLKDKWGYLQNKEEIQWHYIDTKAMLKKAGYKIEGWSK